MDKVVIVNDDRKQLNKLSDLVTKEGLLSETYTDAETALNKIDNKKLPILIITSLYMKGMDGWKFCRLLHSPEYEALNNIPIMVVSASLSGSEPGMIHGDLGVEAFLPTPVDSSYFKKQIKMVREGKAIRRTMHFLLVESKNHKESDLKIFLRKNGYIVDSASTVNESLKRLETQRYDLALLNYPINDGNSEDILYRIVSIQSDCICIMITEDNNPSLPYNWLNKGCYAVIRKPYSHDYLLEICTRARRSYSLVRSQRIIEDRSREASEQSDYLKTILNTTQDGLLIIENNGEIVDSNNAYSKMSGYTIEELKNLSIADLEHELMTSRHLNEIIKNKSYLLETMHKRKDNTVFNVELSITWIGEDINRFVCFIRDITERKNIEKIQKKAEEQQRKLQEQLNSIQKMESIGRLAGGIAHDFNNNLNIILGYLELIFDESSPDEPVKSYLNEIRKAGEHSANLTRQLLAFARKQTVVAERIELNNTIDGMLKMLKHLIGENIDLKLYPGKGQYQIKMAPSQIDQILANLCLNARDAITGHGTIEIQTGSQILDKKYCNENPEYLPGEYIYFIVRDNGCGIDSNEIDKLFDPFYTTKETGKGTGLGLSIVYGIVKQNNGYISVNSTKNKGTEFKILLPEFKGEIKQTIETEIKKIKGNETILLIEDDLAILQMITKMLKQIGYTVLSTVSPVEALRISDEYYGDIDLLITDVVMPDKNGHETAELIKISHPVIKTLYMSGYTSDIIAKNGLIDNNLNFIQKPFSLKVLTENIRTILDS